MNNYDDKIVTIKKTEKALLELVKDKIHENNQIFNNHITEIVDLLNYDSKMVKKYEAVVNAQEQIKELANQIKNANNVEEIVEIRKKLNYFINKVKKEMKQRGISEDIYNKYCENATNLRKSISEDVRYLKRENKINEIERLNDNIADLTEEDSKRLEKLIKNELSYGKRCISNYNIEKIDLSLNEKNELRENEDISEEVQKNSTLKEELDNFFSRSNKKIMDSNLTNESNGFSPRVKIKDFDKKAYSTVYDYLDEQVDVFNQRYKIVQPKKYTKNPIKNLKIYTKNIPILLYNKEKVRFMMRDYSYYHKKSELMGYSEYIKRNSSLLYNLKKSIKGNSLDDKREYYAQEHKKCIYWILDYCKNNDLVISYEKSMA